MNCLEMCLPFSLQSRQFFLNPLSVINALASLTLLFPSSFRVYFVFFLCFFLFFLISGTQTHDELNYFARIYFACKRHTIFTFHYAIKRSTYSYLLHLPVRTHTENWYAHQRAHTPAIAIPTYSIADNVIMYVLIKANELIALTRNTTWFTRIVGFPRKWLMSNY